MNFWIDDFDITIGDQVVYDDGFDSWSGEVIGIDREKQEIYCRDGEGNNQSADLSDAVDFMNKIV